jgi:hypothetical protein
MEMDAARMDYAIDRQLITAWANPATGQRVRTELPPERLESRLSAASRSEETMLGIVDELYTLRVTH